MARPSRRARHRKAVYVATKRVQLGAAEEARLERKRLAKDLGCCQRHLTRGQFAALTGHNNRASLSANHIASKSASNSGAFLGQKRLVDADYEECPSLTNLIAYKGNVRVFAPGKAKGAMICGKARPEFKARYDKNGELIEFVDMGTRACPTGFKRKTVKGTGREEVVFGTSIQYIDGPSALQPDRRGKEVEVERSVRAAGMGNAPKATQQKALREQLKTYRRIVPVKVVTVANCKVCPSGKPCHGHRVLIG